MRLIVGYGADVDVPGTDDRLPPEVTRARRPQWLVLMLIGALVDRADAALWSGSIVEVLTKMGTGSPAVRSTLSRMVDRGLLHRHRRGREMYYALTKEAAQNVARGQAVALAPVDHSWSGVWTVVAASIPERHRALRHRLATRLAWEGFGQLQAGLWATPHEADVPSILRGLDAMEHVRVFTGSLVQPANVNALLHAIYDLDEIAERYDKFIERWTRDPSLRFDDSLSAYLVLISEWAQLVRSDPHLPREHLPDAWRAVDAHRLFLRRLSEIEPQAQDQASGRLRYLSLQTGPDRAGHRSRSAAGSVRPRHG